MFDSNKSNSLYSDRGANIESCDKNNFTPLLSAACEGHTLVVTGLLKRGANQKAEDIHNKTAIFMAAEENCVETLKVKRSLVSIV